MGIVGRQFGRPSGPAGRLASHFMARNNAAFNRWLAAHLAAAVPTPATVVELGSGPGVGLEALLDAFPAALVIGADPSSAVQRQAQRRNRQALADGRLRLVRGDATALDHLEPVDLVVAVHVLYFWREPFEELTRIRGLLSRQGHLALGYQLAHDMPRPAQRDFPRAGHVLYDTDAEVSAVLDAARFDVQEIAVLGAESDPGGRLLIASPR